MMEETLNSTSIPNYAGQSSIKTEVRNLSTYGTEQAAKHRGAVESLKNLLWRIKSGVIVEEGDNGLMQKQYEEDIRSDINAIQEDNSDHQTQINNITQNLIPQSKRKINTYRENIEEVLADAKKGVIDHKYSRLMHVLYAVFSIVLFAFVFFYYASLINMAFFGGQDAAGNIVLGVFDPSIFSHIPDQWMIIFTVPFVFMAAGLFMHQKMVEEKKTFARIFIFVAIVVFEALPAHYITKNHIQIEKQMSMIGSSDFSSGFNGDFSSPTTNNAQEITVGFWEPFQDIQFYMLLLIGLASYVLLAVFIEYLVRENEKRNPEKVAKIDKQKMDNLIRGLESDIDELQTEATKLEGNLEKGGFKINELKEKLNKYIYSPIDLDGKLQSFFNGWLVYINQVKSLKANIEEHHRVFESFKEEINKAA